MLTLTRQAHDAIVEHAREGAPEEVCGVLAGRREDGGDGTDEIRVEAAHRVPNVAADPRTEYRLDPETQLAVHEEVEDAGGEVVGFYHSHPAGPAGPSATDEARATWTGYVHVVVSLAGDGEDGPSVGAWTWTGEGFEAEAVRVEG